jgi:hypothetical protein
MHCKQPWRASTASCCNTQSPYMLKRQSPRCCNASTHTSFPAAAAAAANDASYCAARTCLTPAPTAVPASHLCAGSHHQQAPAALADLCAAAHPRVLLRILLDGVTLA